jgi:hypothetical protein
LTGIRKGVKNATEQPFGPPLAHQPYPEDLVGPFQKAGFGKWTMQELSHTAFYGLDILSKRIGFQMETDSFFVDDH